MPLTPEDKKKIQDSYESFEKGVAELGKALKLGFFSSARLAANGLKNWAADIEKALEKDDEPPKKDEKKP